jgi:hypothetical protein
MSTYCVGDVHGDMESLIAALKGNRILSEGGSWNAGASVLVQMGDILDGGARNLDQFVSPHSDLDVLRYLYALRSQARAAGGDVVCVLGNHEVMNLSGNFTYVSPNDMRDRQRLFDERGPGSVVHMLLSLCKPVVVRGDMVFCHAGITPSMYAAVNGLGRAARSATEFAERVNALVADRVATVGPASLAHNPALVGPSGLTTTRYYYGDGDQAYADVRSMLDEMGCDRMFVGHNFVSKRVTTRCFGRVVLTDTGLSRGISDDRDGEILKIDEDGRVYAMLGGVLRPS